MLEDIVPPQVAVAEAATIPAGGLLPEELPAIAAAVPRRRAEFTAGRSCARAALARLGLPPVPILRGPRGAPQWPAGIAGSITHCAGYAAAAVARHDQVVALGIDAEPDGPLPPDVLGVIASAQEQLVLRQLAAERPGVSWDRLLFCAKEAVYKAWFPLTGRWLGFEDAVVSFAPDRAAFTARLLVPGPLVGGRPLSEFTGRWLVRDGLMVTAIAVPA